MAGCNAGTLYGRGIYFAENGTKSILEKNVWRMFACLEDVFLLDLLFFNVGNKNMVEAKHNSSRNIKFGGWGMDVPPTFFSAMASPCSAADRIHQTQGDEYTTPDSSGIRHLLICRVTLGRIFYTDLKDWGDRGSDPLRSIIYPTGKG